MATPVVVSRIQNRRGTQIQFDALYPPGYSGIGGVDLNLYPNVLMSGELALCTDSRRIFLGNVNGEFVELAQSLSSANGIFLQPAVMTLPPAASFTVIPGLTYAKTPFTTIMYDITDTISPNWNLVGSNFSKNGALEITAVANFVPAPPVPPFPAVTPVTLTDTGTEINRTVPDTITFSARYNVGATNIEILYRHDFASSLTFSTSSLKWIAF